MRKIFLFLITFSIAGFAQKNKNHWQVAKFNGKVKTSRIVEYRPMLNDNVGSLYTEQFTTFNTMGNITEMELNLQGSKTRIVEQYNDKKLIVKSVSYNPEGEVVFLNELSYDDKGNKIEEKALFPDGSLLQKILWKYDNKGNEIEKKLCSADNCFERIVSSYDSKGNVIKELKYDEKHQLFATITYKYDKRNNRTEIVAVDPQGELIQKFTYKFDKRGNETEVVEYDASNTIIDEKTFTYQYDKKKNWILKKEYLEDKIVAKFEQTLEYFK